MKIDKPSFDEFTSPQGIVNSMVWMLQGLAMSPNNEKLLAAYEAVLTIFNSDK